MSPLGDKYCSAGRQPCWRGYYLLECWSGGLPERSTMPTVMQNAQLRSNTNTKNESNRFTVGYAIAPPTAIVLKRIRASQP